VRLDSLLAPIAGALKETLLEWEDPDITAYKLGICLGLFQPDDGSYDQFREYKGVLCTDNAASMFLYETIDRLVVLGLLEADKGKYKYRWNPGSEDRLLA
jgi:hypothetical protein